MVQENEPSKDETYKYNEEVLKNRRNSHTIHPMILSRRSLRSMTALPISDDLLYTLFEAAHWAPSHFNCQNWRFIYARRDSPYWTPFLELLTEKDQPWATDSAVLVVVLSKSSMKSQATGEEIPVPTAPFEAGSAWMAMALEGTARGLALNAITEFDREKAKQVIGLEGENGYSVEAILVIGRPDWYNAEFEDVTTRKELEMFVSEGIFVEKKDEEEEEDAGIGSSAEELMKEEEETKEESKEVEGVAQVEEKAKEVAEESIVLELEIAESDVAEPEIAETEAAETEAAEPEIPEPKVTEPEVTESEVVESDVPEQEIAELDVAEPKVAEPEVSESEIAQPDAAEPEIPKPKVAEEVKDEPAEGETVDKVAENVEAPKGETEDEGTVEESDENEKEKVNEPETVPEIPEVPEVEASAPEEAVTEAEEVNVEEGQNKELGNEETEELESAPVVPEEAETTEAEPVPEPTAE